MSSWRRWGAADDDAPLPPAHAAAVFVDSESGGNESRSVDDDKYGRRRGAGASARGGRRRLLLGLGIVTVLAVCTFLLAPGGGPANPHAKQGSEGSHVAHDKQRDLFSSPLSAPGSGPARRDSGDQHAADDADHGDDAPLTVPTVTLLAQDDADHGDDAPLSVPTKPQRTQDDADHGDDAPLTAAPLGGTPAAAIDPDLQDDDEPLVAVDHDDADQGTYPLAADDDEVDEVRKQNPPTIRPEDDDVNAADVTEDVTAPGPDNRELPPANADAAVAAGVSGGTADGAPQHSSTIDDAEHPTGAAGYHAAAEPDTGDAQLPEDTNPVAYVEIPPTQLALATAHGSPKKAFGAPCSLSAQPAMHSSTLTPDVVRLGMGSQERFLTCTYREAPSYQAGISPGAQCCCKLSPSATVRNASPSAMQAGETRCLPSFVIIGAQKSGSTAMLAYFLHHPQVQPPGKKELHFFDFSRKTSTGLTGYLADFKPVDEGHPEQFITGETTPAYILGKSTSALIRRMLPDARIILVVRHPVERAYSEYQMKVRRVDAAMNPTRLFEEWGFSEKASKCWEESGRPVFVPSKHMSGGKLRKRPAGRPRQPAATGAVTPPRSAATGVATPPRAAATGAVPPPRPTARPATTPTPSRRLQTRPRAPVSMAAPAQTGGNGDGAVDEAGGGGGTSPAVPFRPSQDPVTPNPAGGNPMHPQAKKPPAPSGPPSTDHRMYSNCMAVHLEQMLVDYNMKSQLTRANVQEQSDACFGSGGDPRDERVRGALEVCLRRYYRPPESLEPLVPRFRAEAEQIKRCTATTSRVGEAEELAHVRSFAPSPAEADEAARVGDPDLPESGVRLKWAGTDKGCWPTGATSNIKHDFLFRSLYAPQLIRWLQVFPADQLLIVSDAELKGAPQEVLDKVFEFVGLPGMDVSEIDETSLHEMISRTYPNFEGSSGWRINSVYPPLSEELRAEMVEVFKPYNRELFHLLGRRFDGWDE